MSRQLLENQTIHASIQSQIGGGYDDTLNEIKAAVANNNVVVIGMAHNPFVKKARKRLDGEAVDFHYMEYGSYTKEWRRRLAIKMWSGWPTFPMIFVNGQFVGGKQELDALIDSGEFKQLLPA